MSGHQPTNNGIPLCNSVFQPRDLPDTPSLHTRARIPIPCIWCQIGTATYIIVTQCFPYNYPPYAGHAQMNLIQEALEFLEIALASEGDHLIAGGSYRYSRYGMTLQAQNVNNHQLTLGVVRSSLMALGSFMTAYQVLGPVTLNIYDGANWVGLGTIRSV